MSLFLTLAMYLDIGHQFSWLTSIKFFLINCQDIQLEIFLKSILRIKTEMEPFFLLTTNFT